MSEASHLKLPDGTTKEVAKGTTALDVAKSISPRLADAAPTPVERAHRSARRRVRSGAGDRKVERAPCRITVGF